MQTYCEVERYCVFKYILLKFKPILHTYTDNIVQL